MGRIIYLEKDVVKNFIVKPINLKSNKFYNLKHGNKDGWEIRYSLDGRYFKPKDETDLELKGNSFYLKPIIKDKAPSKDKNNNVYYVITKDNNLDYKRDSYVFWDSDLVFENIKILNQFNMNIIGKGKKSISKINYFSPVIEVFEKGSMVITDGIKTYRLEVCSDKLKLKVL